jgi:hypothetical protein
MSFKDLPNELQDSYAKMSETQQSRVLDAVLAQQIPMEAAIRQIADEITADKIAADKLTRQPVKEPPKEPTKEPVKEPTKEPAKEPAKKEPSKPGKLDAGWTVKEEIHIDRAFFAQMVADFLSVHGQMDDSTSLILERFISTSKGHGFKVDFYGANMHIRKVRKTE